MSAVRLKNTHQLALEEGLISIAELDAHAGVEPLPLDRTPGLEFRIYVSDETPVVDPQPFASTTETVDADGYATFDPEAFGSFWLRIQSDIVINACGSEQCDSTRSLKVHEIGCTDLNPFDSGEGKGVCAFPNVTSHCVFAVDPRRTYVRSIELKLDEAGNLSAQMTGDERHAALNTAYKAVPFPGEVYDAVVAQVFVDPSIIRSHAVAERVVLAVTRNHMPVSVANQLFAFACGRPATRGLGVTATCGVLDPSSAQTTETALTATACSEMTVRNLDDSPTICDEWQSLVDAGAGLTTAERDRRRELIRVARNQAIEAYSSAPQHAANPDCDCVRAATIVEGGPTETVRRAYAAIVQATTQQGVGQPTECFFPPCKPSALRPWIGSAEYPTLVMQRPPDVPDPSCEVGAFCSVSVSAQKIVGLDVEQTCGSTTLDNPEAIAAARRALGADPVVELAGWIAVGAAAFVVLLTLFVFAVRSTARPRPQRRSK